MTVPIHPDAQIFPEMSEDEFERFADSIELRGLAHPITLLDGAILDGRHRQRACDERGIEPRYVDWNPTEDVTPLEWVIAVNLHRRQLSTSQRAALAAEVEPRLAEGRRVRGNDGKYHATNSSHGSRNTKTLRESRMIAGEQFGVGGTTVQKAKRLLRDDPEMFERVKRAEVGLEEAIRKLGATTTRRPRPSKRERYEALRNALRPLRRYAKDWDESDVADLFPAEARRLLKQVQEVDATLFEIERALEARTIVSRALR